MCLCRLTQVFKSTAFIKDPIVKSTSEVNTGAEALRVLRMRTEIHCRRIIKMCKTIDEFTELCENDRIILLKTCCPEIICLTSDSKSAVRMNLDVLKWGKLKYNHDTNLMDLL
ncbi:unnamed protein product [Medioppia subpectinata]|uniref:NR LBD domain-containing protein n=1 Tax=Medioppia subpectinata TaxID=1979941 RepID=A0A7R9KKP3_9ACAR|nr:unnamed protein product [Medioppia subpectinata]CAG2105009.1 unnamed protein product [Medioppia subpectinata]